MLRDPRVVSLEKVNFRHVTGDFLPEKVTLAVVDVSFISLRHILPVLPRFLVPGAEALPLVKPQFEVGKGRVGKGGVVRDDALRREAVDGIAAFARETGYEVLGEAESRVPGPKGNREVFLHLRWPKPPASPEARDCGKVRLTSRGAAGNFLEYARTFYR